jgi:CheY-like chemotaxis protein
MRHEMTHLQCTHQLMHGWPTPIRRPVYLWCCPSVEAMAEPQARQPAPLLLLPASTRPASLPAREHSWTSTEEDPCLIPFPAPVDPPAAPLADLDARPRPCILVVEDDESISEVLHDLFELEGFAVKTASCGATGLLRFSVGDVDLIVLDLKLPDISGLTLCRAIRARENEAAHGSRTPIVVLTAVQADMAAVCRQAGADDFVPKPIEIDALLQTVQQQLAVSRPLADGAI